jgi:hypothetical protein
MPPFFRTVVALRPSRRRIEAKEMETVMRRILYECECGRVFSFLEEERPAVCLHCKRPVKKDESSGLLEATMEVMAEEGATLSGAR